MKRFLSVILALTMVIAMIPAVFAEGEAETTSRTYTFSANETGATAGGAVTAVNSFDYKSKGNGWLYVDIDDDAKAVADSGNPRVYALQGNYLRITSHRTNSNGYIELPNGIRIALAIEKPSTTPGFYKATVATGDYTASHNVQFYMGKWDNVQNPVETYMTDAAKFNSEIKLAAASSATLDGIIYNDGTNDFVFVTDTKGLCTFDLKSLTLDKLASPVVELSIDKTTLGVGEEATASVNVTSEEVTQKLLNEYVTYESSSESVAKVSENGEITAVGKGTATITATVGDESYTKTITVAELSGIKIEYDTYAGTNSGFASAKEINYTRNNGRIEYYTTTSTDDYPYSWDQTAKNQMGEGTYRFIAAFKLAAGSDEYTAYKIRIPVAGDYITSLYYLACANADAARSGSLYILPGNTADIADALANATPVLSDVNFYSETNEFKTTEEVIFSAENAGEYLMVWKNTGDTGTRITPVRLTLNGGDGKAPIWASMSLENSELEVSGTTTLTSTVYASDGKAATDASSVTYESTNKAVATVSGTTVTATGAGVAKIQAKSGDYVLGEADVTVKAPIVLPEEEEITDTKVNFKASAYEGGSVSNANVQEVTMGTDVTVSATANEGYSFAYWKNSAGVVLSTRAEETFKVNTNTAVIAVFDKAPTDDAIPVYFYNGNGMPLGNTSVAKDTSFGEAKTSANIGTPSLTGFAFDKWSIDDNELITALTRAVALYKDDETKTYTVKNGDTTVASGLKYGESVTVNGSDGFTAWKLGDKVISYDKSFTFDVYGNITLTEVTEAIEKAPVLVLDKSGDNYFLTYDSGDYELLEAGILFGSEGVTIGSIDGYKATAKKGTGLFTALPHAGATVSTIARGYMICKSGDEYKVIYAD